MKKYPIWDTRPNYPLVAKWSLVSYKEPIIRTRVKIKAWFSRMTGLFNDDFKRWAKDLTPIVIFILIVIVPFLPKPVFNIICYTLILIFAGWFFILTLIMPLICLAVFIYFFVTVAKESQGAVSTNRLKQTNGQTS